MKFYISTFKRKAIVGLLAISESNESSSKIHKGFQALFWDFLHLKEEHSDSCFLGINIFLVITHIKYANVYVIHT